MSGTAIRFAGSANGSKVIALLAPHALKNVCGPVDDLDRLVSAPQGVGSAEVASRYLTRGRVVRHQRMLPDGTARPHREGARMA